MYDYFLFERILIRTKVAEGCWLWHGAIHSHTGYGSIRVHDRRPMNVQRAMWVSLYGPLDDGMVVGQHCDVRHCVRPSHLYAGSRADAMRDKKLKGRLKWKPDDKRRKDPDFFYGTNNGQSKLTEDQVREIRAKYTTGGWSYAELARRFNVTKGTIYQVVKRKIWKNVE